MLVIQKRLVMIRVILMEVYASALQDVHLYHQTLFLTITYKCCFRTFAIIFIKLGKIVLYESARCYHGRPKPFKGDNFANIFGHTRPVGFQPTIDYLDGLVKIIE